MIAEVLIASLLASLTTIVVASLRFVARWEEKEDEVDLDSLSKEEVADRWRVFGEQVEYWKSVEAREDWSSPRASLARDEGHKLQVAIAALSASVRRHPRRA